MDSPFHPETAARVKAEQRVKELTRENRVLASAKQKTTAKQTNTAIQYKEEMAALAVSFVQLNYITRIGKHLEWATSAHSICSLVAEVIIAFSTTHSICFLVRRILFVPL